jgi:O-acetyl-ADP-ribose deacetylase
VRAAQVLRFPHRHMQGLAPDPTVIAFSLPPITVEILDGDITAERVDAVLNAANNQFWMGAGVAGALKARGGTEIEQEAMAQGPVEPGECVVTAGHRLPARYVIHAAVMGQDLRTSARLIMRATGAALSAADRLGAQSIALPAFGTGIGGFSMGECARIMIGAVKEHAPAGRTVRTVRFVLFGEAAYRAFAEAAGDLLGTPASGSPDCPLST